LDQEGQIPFLSDLSVEQLQAEIDRRMDGKDSNQLDTELQRRKEGTAAVEQQRDERKGSEEKEHQEFRSFMENALLRNDFHNCQFKFVADTDDLAVMLRTVVNTSLNEDGTVVYLMNKQTGKRVDFNAAVEAMVLKFPNVVDERFLAPGQRSIIAIAKGETVNPQESYRGDFKTPREKALAIDRLGLDAWTRMKQSRPTEPAKRMPGNPSLMNRSEWFAHTVAERAVLMSKMAAMGLDVERTVAQILRRK